MKLLQLRLSPTAHARLRRLAEEQGASLNRIVAWSIRHFGRCRVAKDERARRTGGES
jgi:hypothetical protein